DTAQYEEQPGLVIKPCADTIERRGDMLAHIRPIRTAAGQLDFAGRRKQAIALPAHPVHDALGQAALQKLDQRVDRAGAILADSFPVCRLDRPDGDLDLVELRTRDQRGDLALADLQVDDGTVAHIGATARYAVFIVAVPLEIVAPRSAPEGLADDAPLDCYG